MIDLVVQCDRSRPYPHSSISTTSAIDISQRRTPTSPPPAMEETPPALRSLEADWRGLRRVRIEASLRRRAANPSVLAISPTQPETLPATPRQERAKGFLLGSSNHKEPTQSGSELGGASDIGKRCATRRPLEAEGITSVLEISTKQPDPRHHIRPVRSKPQENQTAHSPGSKRIGTHPGKPKAITTTLPCGTYSLPKDAGTLLVRNSSLVSTTNPSYSVHLFLDNTRYDFSPDGRACNVTETSRPQVSRKLPVVMRLEDISSWSRGQVRVWHHLEGLLDQVQKRTDQVSRFPC